MGVVPACVYMHHLHAWCLWRSEEGVQSSESRVIEDCDHVGTGNQTLVLIKAPNDFNHCANSPVLPGFLSAGWVGRLSEQLALPFLSLRYRCHDRNNCRLCTHFLLKNLAYFIKHIIVRTGNIWSFCQGLMLTHPVLLHSGKRPIDSRA